ncbi:beta-lactamase [alpha proteobacterium U9-1i]|nr:beta-lactamase [alpha proteobacterium U9-1i]
MHRRALLAAAASSLAPTLACAQATPGRFAAAADYSAQRAGVSMLVARNGVVLAEYYTERDEDWRWQIGAGTRPFAALLMATMVEERLASLDEPVAMTLGDWGAHPIKSTINIRGLLNGTSGLAFRRGDDQNLATAILLEPTETPGQSFGADAAAYLLLGEIARRKLEARGRGSDPALYLMERTLAPIGCVPVGWARGDDGAARFDTGAAVSARGWAQVGELIRREGVYRAQQLADDNALREATQGSFAEARAGFGLWIAAPGRGRGQLPVDSDLWRASSPAPMDLAMAAGEGGQRLYIVRSENLVIVRQSRLQEGNGGWSDAAFLSLIWRDLMRR